MKRLTQTLPIFLAAALQIMPLVRNLFANPAAGNTIAFILRWGIGSAAAIGTVDAVSGATTVFTSPSTYSGTVGTAFNGAVSVTIGGGHVASVNDYFVLQSGTTISPVILNGQSTSVALPTGLTFTAAWVNGSTTMGGTISGTPTTSGNYSTTVSVVCPCGYTLSQNVTITIGSGGTAPSITGQPASLARPVGSNATFTVTAGGTAPLTYQWYYSVTGVNGWTSLSGATSPALALNNLQTTNGGYYCAIVNNAYGSKTSTIVQLAVGLPPGIGGQPVGWTNNVGSNAVFTVIAGGTAPLTYQWYFSLTGTGGWRSVGGATNSTLTLNNVQTNNAGYYCVIVNNAYGSKTSALAQLTVNTAPTVTGQPASLTKIVGSNATFTVSAAGTAPLTFQWYFSTNGQTGWGAIPNATGAALALTNVQLSDAGYYQAGITNPYGSAVSSNAQLTIGQPPTITLQPIGVTNGVGSNAAFTVTAGGSAPLTYQWYFSLTGTNGWHSVLVATNAALTLNNLQTTNAGYFCVIVGNPYGSKISAIVPLAVIASIPNITLQPVGVTNGVGSNAVFTVIAGGTAPLTYQWYYSVTGTNGWHSVLAATNSTLTLNNLQTTNAGYFCVIAGNPYGSQISAIVPLAVIASIPGITLQPVGVTNGVGSNAVFTVIAGGTAPLTYQWYFSITGTNGWHAVPAATNATLTLNNLQTTNAGYFCVIIGNPYGSKISAIVPLAVTVGLTPAAIPLTRLATPLSLVAPNRKGAQFQFTFTPVAGHTNAVLTNGVPIGGTWGVLTNLPPTDSPTPITITDSPGRDSLFYRVQVR